jgi:hypothetical protein
MDPARTCGASATARAKAAKAQARGLGEKRVTGLERYEATQGFVKATPSLGGVGVAWPMRGKSG